MSHRQSKTSVLFSCDAEGCGETFDSPILSIRGAWADAEQFGWRYLNDYVAMVSRMFHYCPSHAKIRMIR